ncbi:ROK family transcriptional regulator [Nakamurella lactea]|uniref:ROK family transcriptional regulator n=1 Tax=Nakamurella lactea TaxID=459515 RepID=UPI00040F2E2C|nr:ROK family protein [Nakamurella lactea]
MNETLVLARIRAQGKVSRADLVRACELSKPTVSLALTNLERAELIRTSGVRTGLPGPAAALYELLPQARHVLALDVGRQYLRGALGDFAGAVRARGSVRVHGSSGHALVPELVRLADSLCAEAGIDRAAVSQTVLGSPGVHDARRDTLALAGALTGWDAGVIHELREAFGASLMFENDVDAAALAEQEHGHGREVDSFGFVSVGTGIGMGLVLNGQLHRGTHGAAGEIGYLPFDRPADSGSRDARRRGPLEASASAAGIVRAARRAGLLGPVSARRVFEAAAKGDPRAQQVVADEAALVAKAICAVVTVVDPELIVLGGGVGRADGFVDAVRDQLTRIAPVLPQLRVSALGDDAVVDGALAAGLERVWQLVNARLSAPA